MSDKSERATLFELKERAKWSHDPEEKKAAIKELTTQGHQALPQLEEILNITVYEEIRNACADAIRSIKTNAGENIETLNVGDSGSAASQSKPAQLQKKGEREKGPEAEIRLADLPP